MRDAKARCADEFAIFREKPMQMKSNRLEAFSDGVLAIIITIMVLELKVPKGADLATLQQVTPPF